MLSNLLNIFTNNEEFNAPVTRGLSLFFLTLAGSISFMSFTSVGWVSKTTYSFYPDITSGLIGSLFVAPLYFRNILQWSKSFYGIFSFALILLVFSAYVSLAKGGNTHGSFFGIDIITLLLSVSIVLSWLGMRGIAGICWIMLLATGLYSLSCSNHDLGFWGFLYILFSFLGLILHTGLNPGSLLVELKAEYSSSAVSSAARVKSDVQDAGVMIKNAANGVKSAAKIYIGGR